MCKPNRSNILLKFKKTKYVTVVFKAETLDTTAIGMKLINYGAEVTGRVNLIDTYYEVPKGVLKLREVKGRSDAALMYYETNDTCEAENGVCLVFTLSPSGYFKHVLQEILVIKAVVNKVGETYTSNGIHVLLADVGSKCSFVELELRISLDPQQEEMSLLRLMKLGELLGFQQADKYTCTLV